jgi:hypothetical protein
VEERLAGLEIAGDGASLDQRLSLPRRRTPPRSSEASRRASGRALRRGRPDGAPRRRGAPLPPRSARRGV